MSLNPSEQMVTLTIDAKEITVPAGTLIIRAAEQVGVEIPRFCDHPMLEPVGACRQCYVEVEGQRKLFTSCTTVVSDGMVVRTQNTMRATAAATSRTQSVTKKAIARWRRVTRRFYP